MDTSSAETGSSQMISLGRSASARATPMRCRWPPENSAGNRLKCSGLRPTRAIRSWTARLRSAPVAVLWTGHGAAVMGAAARGEGAVGVLEDHLDLAADRLHDAAGQVGDVAALEVDLARGDRDQPGDA